MSTAGAAPRPAAAAEAAASVDLHAHPGLLPMFASDSLPGHGARMRRGGVCAVVLAAIGDLPVLGPTAAGGIGAIREPEPGELAGSTREQIEYLTARAAEAGLPRVLAPATLAPPTGDGTPGVILAVEGCDFLEGRLEGVEAAHARGVRSLQLVHYRVNEVGDIQTEPPRHRGLTGFGRDVVREMNRLGMLVDLAHATYETTAAAAAASGHPIVVSHTCLRDTSGVSRFISEEHARVVVETGGMIGAWPFAREGGGLADFADRISRLVDVAGIDHVGIGTDMDGLPRPFALFADYEEWPSIGDALRARGYTRAEVAALLGGNFRRVFRAVAGAG